MNNMIRIENRLINKNCIYYVKKEEENLKVTITTKTLDNFEIIYSSYAKFIKLTNTLQRIGFVSIETFLLDLDKVVYIDIIKKEEIDYLKVIFDNNIPLLISLEKSQYKLEDIIEDLLLDSRYTKFRFYETIDDID